MVMVKERLPSWASPAREEKFQISLTLNGSKLSQAQRDEVATFVNRNAKRLKGPPWRLGETETIDVTYNLDIDYWGQVVQNIEAMLKLYDWASITSASTKELKHGKSLIQDLLCKLEQLEKKYTK